MSKLKALLAASLFLLSPFPAHSKVVTKIVDGDTIDTDAGRVRLSCVDSPEMTQKPYGSLAKEALQELLPIGTTVTLKPRGKASYGRVAAEVFASGKNINLEMVKMGYAYVSPGYVRLCDEKTYKEAEVKSWLNHRNLWQYEVEKPWDYRRRKRCPCLKSS